MAVNWQGYYAKTAGRPPRRTTLAALRSFPEGGEGRSAVDLGCGDGRDAIEMLRQGWSVMAIDAEPEAIERLRSRSDLPEAARLTVLCRRFEEAEWPLADLINASFSLPLCEARSFPALWERMRRSLKPCGRFAGQLYGLHDGWAGSPGMTHHSRDEVEGLLAGFDVELFEEEESDAVTPRGKMKHWHIFHIVGRLLS